MTAFGLNLVSRHFSECCLWTKFGFKTFRIIAFGLNLFSRLFWILSLE